MRKSLLMLSFILMTISSATLAQDDNNSRKQVLKSDTSLIQKLIEFRDSTSKANEEEANRKALLQLQQERNKKEKRAAVIRIGIGVLLLAVLVVGLMRKRKK